MKNKSDIYNPNNDAYWQARGFEQRPDNWEELSADISSASIQDINNPNNDAYWQARGWDRRPEEWRELVRGPYDGGYTGAMCKDDY